MDFESMSFIAGFVDSEYLWAINDQDGGLYRISRITFNLELMLEVKEKSFYYHAIGRNGKIFFFPQLLNDDILVYDTITNSLEKIKLQETRLKTSAAFKSKYYECIVLEIKKDGVVWLFPHWGQNAAIKFNIFENSVEFIDQWISLSAKSHIDAIDVCTGYGKIWFPSFASSILIEFDPITMKIKKNILQGYKLRTISFDGTDFWLSLTNSADVVSWNAEKKTLVRYKNNGKSKTLRFGSIICIDNRVILLPVNNIQLYLVDKENQCIIPLNNMPKNFKIYPNHQCVYYWGYQIIGNNLWIFPACGNQLLILDTITWKLTGIELKIQDFKLLYKQYLETQEILIERRNYDLFTLQGLCKILKPMDHKCEKEGMTDSGKNILNYIKKLN